MKDLVAKRTRWFWLGLLAGFLTSVLVVTLYLTVERLLVEREARELAQSYPEVGPAFETAGEEFAAELVRIFEDLPVGDVEATTQLWYRGCEGTHQQAKRYDAILRGTGYEDSSELHAAIKAVDAQLEAAPEWSTVDHEPPHDGMGGWETWSYQWEHEGATITMEVEAQELSERTPVLNVDISSECYYVQDLATGNNRFGPEELQ